ncbi:MAG: sulfatase [Opitutales bacterium]
MKRLIIISAFCLSVLGAFAKDTRPNIIVFLTDDQMRNSTGVYGNKQVKTPNMDKLANNGVIFANNYATTSICMASRACIMTGMYEYKTGCNFNTFGLSEKTFSKSYPMILKDAGYYVGFAGKFGFAVTPEEGGSPTHIKYEQMPVDSFDNFAGGLNQTDYNTAKNKNIAKYAKEYPHSTRAYGAFCSDFIREAKATGKPFCLSMSFKAPHKPNSPDPFFDDIYKDVVWEQPSNFGRENGKHLAPQSRMGRQYKSLFESFGYEKDYQNTTRQYHQLIYGVDYAIGMILETLEKEGLADNTIIILTSDNGYNAGSHGFGGKVFAYEEATKTPLIIYNPKAKKADSIWRNSVTANIDLAPTILDYAGIEIPENMDGKSLRTVIDSPKAKVRDVLALINVWINDPTISYSVVSEDYKYIYWANAEKVPATQEFFHISKDRQEMSNEINNPEYKPALDDMKAKYAVELDRWKKNSIDAEVYTRFATIFDQDIDWADKKALANISARTKAGTEAPAASGRKARKAANKNKE